MRLAGTVHSVLISGMPGSGRTQIAQRIHLDSIRKEKPFVVFDCTSAPQAVLEEELFGVEQPDKSHLPHKRGFFEIAQGGTLVLHEISCIPKPLQQKIADALTRKSIIRKNGTDVLPTDVRIIATTLVDINRLTAVDILNADFMEMFKTSILEVPPLKQRIEDILPLAKYFLREFLPKNQRIPEFSKETASILKRYGWPGNIQELAQTMRYVAAVCNDHQVELGDLPRLVRENLAPKIDSGEPLRKQLDHLESEIIRQALERNNRIVTRAANELGLSESTLRYRMHRLKLAIEKEI
jgi:two-component system, NtrC family, response regulator AtoC